MQQQIIICTTEQLREIITDIISSANVNFSAPQSDRINPKELLTRRQAAEILGVSLPSLNTWTKQGKIKGYKISSRVRYKREDISAAFININKQN